MNRPIRHPGAFNDRLNELQSNSSQTVSEKLRKAYDDVYRKNTDISKIALVENGYNLPGYAVSYWPDHCRIAGMNRTKDNLGILFSNFIMKSEVNAKFAE